MTDLYESILAFLGRSDDDSAPLPAIQTPLTLSYVRSNDDGSAMDVSMGIRLGDLLDLVGQAEQAGSLRIRLREATAAMVASERERDAAVEANMNLVSTMAQRQAESCAPLAMFEPALREKAATLARALRAVVAAVKALPVVTPADARTRLSEALRLTEEAFPEVAPRDSIPF